MGDLPRTANTTQAVITPGSEYSLGMELGNLINIINSVQTNWPAANRAIFYPFRVNSTITITNFFWINGTIAGDNIDVGVYDAQGNRIVSIGSTVTSGTSVLQSVSVAATTIQRGLYYLAIAHSGTTTVAWGSTITTPMGRLMGIYRMNTALPLPSAATFTVAGANEVVLSSVGLTATGLV